jgi:oligoendopeptidase F
MRELWRFACESYLGALTRTEEERLTTLEAGLEANIGSERIAFRMLGSEIANSDDRERRERLERARCSLIEHELNPLELDLRKRLRVAVLGLGSESAIDLYRRFGLPLDDLAAQCRSFLAATEKLYERALERLLGMRLGLRLDQVARYDTPRLFRANRWDAAFPADRMLPALEATLAGLGIDLRSQKNVEIDVASRPSKSPRAFCAPIEIPGRIVLVTKPIGGPDDWRALFHEAGHSEHFAHTSADLPFEYRRRGDDAVTEGWAFLFEGMISNPAWLTRLLGAEEVRELCWEGATQKLYFVRRYCAKLLYELELHAATDLTEMPSRYVELLRNATLIEPSPTDYLRDLDEGFYCTSYLRAWAFEARVRTALSERFGRKWFKRLEAGELLRGLWSQGQRLNADELLRQLDGSRLELPALATELAETLG